jgi:hypothetical protein
MAYGEHIMTAEIDKKEEPKEMGITFKCKFCQISKPLEDMVVITRFFPPVVACRDCDKKMR